MRFKKIAFDLIVKTFVVAILQICCSPQQAYSQKKFKADTAKMAIHSAAKATMYSAVLPGLGQIYNRQYYKAPIVYIGLGIAAGFIIYNNRIYTDYRTAYRNFYLDKDPESYQNLEHYYDFLDRNQQLAHFKEVRDTYRRWLEMSYIAFGALYLLNIAEANVSAHFMKFDIDEDLSLKVTPSLQPSFGSDYLAKGLTLSFSF